MIERKDVYSIGLTEEELLSLLKNFEDSFVERKSAGDSKDWLKTVVAFANSAPIGYPAVLFIGVQNDGTPEKIDRDLDSLQRTFSEKLKAVYPTVYYLPKIVRCNGIQVLAVIVPGSQDRPHFSGPAYIREGSKSVNASRMQFDTLIAERNSIAYHIRQWKGKTVSFYMMDQWGTSPYQGHAFTVVDCNQFFITLRTQDIPYQLMSFALRQVDLSYDHKSNRLVVGVSYK